MTATDRFGIGYRPELAAGILSNLDELDVVEVIADDYFDAPRKKRRALETLAAQVPVVLHGVSLGLASSSAVNERRLGAMARVVEAVRPQFWSEHLAFVRGGGLEIGHLAAPPRTEATAEGTAKNIERAHAVVGSIPLLENVATLIDPPGSSFDEASWVSLATAPASAPLLLDLNNLYSNATNFRYDPVDFLTRIPLERVRAVHIAGGTWVDASTGERRLLDDHFHEVPDAVFELLAEVGARTRQGLVVLLERDGAYPPFDALLTELAKARHALAAGRRRAATPPAQSIAHTSARGSEAQGPAFEAYLARLYVDGAERARFLENPQREAGRAGLSSHERDALAVFDRVGLELAARSFAWKRTKLRKPGLTG